jgi:protein SCO1/2
MLSVSVDALGDDPARVAQWLARWGAGPSWQGGVVQSEQLDQWLAYLSPRTGPADAGKARAPTERHSAQVFLFDAQARLAWRSTDLPAPEGVAQTLRELLRG